MQSEFFIFNGVHRRGFILAVSVYIVSSIGFFLWTSLSSNLGFIETTRYAVAALFSASFIFFVPKRLMVGRLSPIIIFLYYCVVVLTANGQVEYLIMYLLWFLFVVIVAPALFSINLSVFFEYVRSLYGLSIILVILTYVYSLVSGESVYFGGEHRLRYTGGLSNPGIYSKLIVSIIWLGILLYVFTKRYRYFLFLPPLLFALYVTNLRTDIFGLLFGVLALLSFNSQYPLRNTILLLGSGVLLVVLVSLNMSIYQLDVLTSGRIFLWLNLYNESGFDESWLTFLFGSGVFTAHFDNQWLKTLLMFGSVGFILYAYMIFYMIVSIGLARKRCYHLGLKGVYAWAQSTVFMFSVMGVTTFIFPSLGNAYNILIFPVLIAVLVMSGKSDIN